MDRLIYIASPYTIGDVVLNVRESLVAAERINEEGDLPIVPLLSHFWHFVFPHEHSYWMEMDFKWVRRCDAVLRLEGASKGADDEVALAKSLAKPVYFGLHQLYPSKYFISRP